MKILIKLATKNSAKFLFKTNPTDQVAISEKLGGRAEWAKKQLRGETAIKLDTLGDLTKLKFFSRENVITLLDTKEAQRNWTRKNGGTPQNSARYVMALQAGLQMLGETPGEVDALYGDKTRSAVLSFQKKYGLKVDGAPGPETIGKMLELLKAEEQKNPAKNKEKEENENDSEKIKKEFTDKAQKLIDQLDGNQKIAWSAALKAILTDFKASESYRDEWLEDLEKTITKNPAKKEIKNDEREKKEERMIKSEDKKLQNSPRKKIKEFQPIKIDGTKVSKSHIIDKNIRKFKNVPEKHNNNENKEKNENLKFEDWELIKKENDKINSLSDIDKINWFQINKKNGESYVIVDKQKGVIQIYDGKSTKPQYISNVDLGAIKGDGQTTTKIDMKAADKNKDGIISKNEAAVTKADYSKGNKMTGAGIFHTSNRYNKNIQHPVINLMNENQYYEYLKNGKMSTIGMSFHYKYRKDNNNRVSNGCMRLSKKTLNNMTKLPPLTNVYVLPEDEGNNFKYENGKLNFRVNSKKDYNKYIDKNGIERKGEGINRTINTLKYIPIKIEIDSDLFKKDVYQTFDFNDEEEFNKTTIPFIKSLEKNKKTVMKIAKINGDVYNDIAKIAFGIYGTESNFGDTNSAIGNFGRASRKWFMKKFFDSNNYSSPDYKSKYKTYNLKEDYRSAGLTQIRFAYLNEKEREALKKVGINSNKDFINPEKAALGTAIVLGIRYNEQLTPEQKKDPMKYLPIKWNRRKNYPGRVRKNSKYITIKQAVE